MTRIRYAAYGSNLHPERLRARTPSAALKGTGMLEGFGLRFHKRGRDRSGKCNILESGEGVYVAIYELSVEDKSELDQIEGVGNGYRSDVIDVAGFGECFVYHAEETHIDDELLPFDWYHEMVLLGCAAHAFPKTYVDRIADVEPLVDGHEQRSEDNWETVEVLRRANGKKR